MCIRDSHYFVDEKYRKQGEYKSYYDDGQLWGHAFFINDKRCLLYTSDAADDLLCVDLGGRRIIKKQKKLPPQQHTHPSTT